MQSIKEYVYFSKVNFSLVYLQYTCQTGVKKKIVYYDVGKSYFKLGLILEIVAYPFPKTVEYEL